ncbi:MAG: hypothetical protein ACM3NW_12125 [Syntrophomonadaceae bacterium]
MIAPAALLALAFFGTATPSSARPLPEGTWGGAGVALTVTAKGGDLEFACAYGKLDEPIAPDAEGRFAARGVYVQERPGPVRPDDLAGKRARYVGRISGDSMTVSISVEGSDAEIGPYTLERGRLPRIVKCR